MDPAVLSDPVHVVSGASVHVETLHHRGDLCHTGAEDLPPGYTIREMPKNGKNIPMNLMFSSQLTDVKSP